MVKSSVPIRLVREIANDRSEMGRNIVRGLSFVT